MGTPVTEEIRTLRGHITWGKPILGERYRIGFDTHDGVIHLLTWNDDFDSIFPCIGVESTVKVMGNVIVEWEEM